MPIRGLQLHRPNNAAVPLKHSMSNILRLVYLSRPTATMDNEAIDTLLNQARERNPLLEVTGVLCSGRGFFVQVLEGPENNVVTLYARILSDPRHQLPSMLSIGLSSRRAFAQWSMAHIPGNLLDDATHSKLLEKAVMNGDLSEQAKVLQSTLLALRQAA